MIKKTKIMVKRWEYFVKESKYSVSDIEILTFSEIISGRSSILSDLLLGKGMGIDVPDEIINRNIRACNETFEQWTRSLTAQRIREIKEERK